MMTIVIWPVLNVLYTCVVSHLFVHVHTNVPALSLYIFINCYCNVLVTIIIFIDLIVQYDGVKVK